MNAYAVIPDLEPVDSSSGERAMWCAALALLLDDARRFHTHGTDAPGDVPGSGHRALRDVLERGPMIRRLCAFADIEPDWLCWRFEQSLQRVPLRAAAG